MVQCAYGLTQQVWRAECDGDGPDEHVIVADAGNGMVVDDGQRLVLYNGLSSLSFALDTLETYGLNDKGLHELWNSGGSTLR